jgi:mutator protein MutT
MSKIIVRFGDSSKKMEDSLFVCKGFIVNDDGKVLLLRRANDAVSYAGKWDLPGGHIHKGEGKEAGLSREIYEETGLTISNPVKLDDDSIPNQFFFVVKEWQGEVQLSFEHDDLAWVDLKTELDDYPCGPNYEKVLRHYAQHN